MLIFRSIARPIWRRTWVRLLLLSSSTLGILLLAAPRLPSEWALIPGTLADAPDTANDADNTQTSAQLTPAQSAVLKSEQQAERLIKTDSLIRPYLALTQLSHGLTERVVTQGRAADSYSRAIALAQAALALRQQGSNQASEHITHAGGRHTRVAERANTRCRSAVGDQRARAFQDHDGVGHCLQLGQSG